MGEIQSAILHAMRESDGPCRPCDLHRIITSRLDNGVSYDTIASFLSVAARGDKWPIVRVAPGRYSIGSSH